MCLAVPGKIIKIAGDSATVDYDLEQREGKLLEPDSGEYKEGDYVIISGGFIVQKIAKKEAKESLRMYKEAVK